MPRADSGWWLVVPLSIVGVGLGLLVSQLNNYTLAPISRGAGQRGGRRQLGGRLVRAVVRAGLRGRDHAGHAVDRVHAPGPGEHGARAGRAAAGRNGPRGRRRADEQHPARELLAGAAAGRAGRDRPDQHRARPTALQIALLVPLLAGLRRAGRTRSGWRASRTRAVGASRAWCSADPPPSAGPPPIRRRPPVPRRRSARPPPPIRPSPADHARRGDHHGPTVLPSGCVTPQKPLTSPCRAAFRGQRGRREQPEGSVGQATGGDGEDASDREDGERDEARPCSSPAALLPRSRS